MTTLLFAKLVGWALVFVSSICGVGLVWTIASDEPELFAPIILIPAMFICGLGLLGVFG